MHILLQLGWFGGWVLGIIGFFSALCAHAELRHLRIELARQVTQPLAINPAPVASKAAIAPATKPPPANPPLPLRDLEALLTTSWSVWLGSTALLFAGIFLVRYAVEQALLGPAARCSLAMLLGLVLLTAAEFLHRHEAPPLAGAFRIDQAPSGLAAGGTAVLFGSAYGAGPLLGLLPPLIAFAAMAAASLIALTAALCYGPLTAATGIVGAFATPALVATQTPSLPGLFAYLLVVSAAALLVVRRAGWIWLAWATTIASALWICFAGLSAEPNRWAAAAFIPAAVAFNLLLLPEAALEQPAGRRLAWVPFAAMGTAGLVLETFAPGMASRAALFLLSPIAVCKGVVEPRLDRLPWIAALFGLLTLLLWTLSPWMPLEEAIHVQGLVQALPPAAQVAPPVIAAAGLLAAFHAAAGLWQQRRAANPLHWAALVAAVPVLSLAAAYARITGFQTDITWAAAALALTVGLTALAAAAAHSNKRPRAGVHAAGAVAALALGCAMLLHDNWLTLAVALFLPPLAWIEARADLPALRLVALAVAALIIVRLVLNPYVLDYAFGTMPLVNGLLPGYAVPTSAFASAAAMFRRRTDDRLVATLEAGAIIFLALFVALEIRHTHGGGYLARPARFTEVALHLLAIAIQANAYLYLAQHGIAQGAERRVLSWAWRILGGMALADAVAILPLNPMVTGVSAGVFTLSAAYLAPACLAALARRRVADDKLRTGLGAYAVVAGFVWITLQIRQYFHPGGMGWGSAPIEAPELGVGPAGGWLTGPG
ncbi:DUF2339 domain-containing protein [Rhodopila sp.]|uniref:DUF2339 domain-containing protein n=1 Tax=Rhodopila sp. TaxID=2480087 RepID=UPI003D0C51D6